jgi:hypothetical protein
LHIYNQLLTRMMNYYLATYVATATAVDEANPLPVAAPVAAAMMNFLARKEVVPWEESDGSKSAEGPIPVGANPDGAKSDEGAKHVAADRECPMSDAGAVVLLDEAQRQTSAYTK